LMKHEVGSGHVVVPITKGFISH